MDTSQSEGRGAVGGAQLGISDGDLRLHEDAVEINFDAIAWVGIFCTVVQIKCVERDVHLVIRPQGGRKVKVIAQVVVVGCKGALGTFFIGQNDTHRGVGAIGGDDSVDGGRIFACEVVIVVALLSDFRAVRTSRKRIDAAIFLDEARVWAAAIPERPAIIVSAAGPGEYNARDGDKFNIVEAERRSAPLTAVTDSFEGHDVIEAGTCLCVYTVRREARSRNSVAQLRRAD